MEEVGYFFWENGWEGTVRQKEGDTSRNAVPKGKEQVGLSRPVRKKESPLWLKDYERDPVGKGKK